MATVYYPKFQACRINADNVRVAVASATINVYNVTASSSLGTISSDSVGDVAEGSFTATAGDIVRMSHGTYPEVAYFTLAATKAEAYVDPSNPAAYVMENLGDVVRSPSVLIYAQDTDDPNATPILIGSGLAGSTVEIPMQYNVAKNFRLFPVSVSEQNSFAHPIDPDNYQDIAIPSTDSIISLADDAWEGVRRNYADDGFEAYNTRASRPLFELFQDRRTVSTASETVHTYSIDKSQFAVNGDTIIAEYTGKLAANANTKYIYLRFNGVTILNTDDYIGPSLGNNQKWRIHVTLTRMNNTTIRYGVDFHVYGQDPYCTEGELTGLALPSPISNGTVYSLVLDLETPTTAGDATLTLANARFVNAAAESMVTSSRWAYFEADSYNGAGVALPTDGSNLSAAWQDLSGNGRHATVSGSPTFETGEINGLSCVRVGADSNDYFQLPSMSSLTAATVFIVQKVTTVSVNGGHFFGTSGNASHYPYEPDTPDTIYDDFCSTVRKTCGPSIATITNWHSLRVYSASSNWGMYQNGMKVFTTTTNTFGGASAPKIGTNGSTYMKADIAAVYIYSNNMSAANVLQMERYLAWKWGV